MVKKKKRPSEVNKGGDFLKSHNVFRGTVSIRTLYAQLYSRPCDKIWGRKDV